jgi:hypothetical protein
MVFTRTCKQAAAAARTSKDSMASTHWGFKAVRQMRHEHCGIAQQNKHLHCGRERAHKGTPQLG